MIRLCRTSFTKPFRPGENDYKYAIAVMVG